MRIEINVADVADVDKRWRTHVVPGIERGMAKCVLDAAHAGQLVARSLVPVSALQKIHLRDMIVAKVVGSRSAAGGLEAEAVLEANTDYASFVENGTRPHVIRAKNASTLAWEGEGGQGDWHFAKEVHHPGTRPHPYMGPAYIKIEQALEASLEALADDAAKTFDQG